MTNGNITGRSQRPRFEKLSKNEKDAYFKIYGLLAKPVAPTPEKRNPTDQISTISDDPMIP